MTKILLVEDDKSLREIYGVRLLAEGYDITSAGDGEEALAVAIKERPSLILSDVMMPKISGFDMLDILRSTTETRDIKVVMMTALSSEDQRARGEALGADRYLVKSQVGIEDVVRTIHEVLADAPAPVATPTQAPSTYAPAQPAPAPVAPAPQPQPAPAPTYTEPVVQQQPVYQTPAPQPEQPQPQQQQPQYAPAPQQYQQQPQQQQQAPQQQPQAAPQSYYTQPSQQPTTLPEPTAPFSTPRPASLAERVINPLSSEESFDNPAAGAGLAAKMDEELNDVPQNPFPPAPAA